MLWKQNNNALKYNSYSRFPTLNDISTQYNIIIKEKATFCFFKKQFVFVLFTN